MRPSSVASLLASGALTLAACSAPAELVVVVHEGSGGALRSVTVAIDGVPEQRSAEGSSAPWTLGVSGRGGETVDVRVTGVFDAGPVVHHAQLALVAGERRTHHVHLNVACSGVICADESTCEGAEAACVCAARGTCPFRVVGSEIEECEVTVRGTGCGLDGGPMGSDAGPVDAGPEECTSGFCDLCAGRRHVCAIDAEGAVFCWGANGAGQLGDDGPPRGSPRRVQGSLSARQVEAGRRFTCAISRVGEVFCWGDNARSQLGTADEGSRSTPARVLDLPPAVDLAVGDAFACALDELGVVRCWGDNTSRQVVMGDQTQVAEPQSVGLPFTPVGVAAGARHACAWDAAGDILCWGDDSSKQALGNRRTTLRAPIVDVGAGDAHTCALLDDEGSTEVQCWGGNTFRQVSPSLALDEAAPVRVTGLSGPTEIAVGAWSTCALVDGRRVCWGRNESGSLAVDQVSPVVAEPTMSRDIAASTVSLGDGFGCAVSGERVRCWGWDLAGAVGVGAEIVVTTPREVQTPTPVRELSLGGNFACALLTGSPPVCWGAGERGQLGRGALVRASAVALAIANPPSGTQSLTTGDAHACFSAQGSPRQVLCWGDNRDGQAGGLDGLPTLTPTSVFGGGAIRVAAGARHTCARSLESGSEIWCWGASSHQQTGSMPMGAAPSPLDGFHHTEFHTLRLGGAHSCVLFESEFLGFPQTRCWGSNEFEQLGVGTQALTVPTAELVFEGNDTQALELATGANFTCIARSDSLIECVGRNAHGQLGHAPSAPQETPLGHGVQGQILAETLTAGARHACVAHQAGGAAHVVECWGDNRHGQLGRTGGPAPGSVDLSALPEMEPRLIVAGERSTCLVTDDGVLYCWGSDEDGRLGLGRRLVYDSPQTVSF